MNKSLYTSYWALIVTAVITSVMAGLVAFDLLKIKQVNQFINQVNMDIKQIPEHVNAQFAQAYFDVEQESMTQALDRLTTVITSDDSTLQAVAYYNRANINLRAAQALGTDNPERLSLVGLAKQDYRQALRIDNKLKEARFNLELALLMEPELPSDGEQTSAIKSGVKRQIKSKAFRVDLP